MPEKQFAIDDEQYDFAFLKLRPPAKALSCDVIMYAVEIWGEESKWVHRPQDEKWTRKP